jgi:hypothetical protein
MKKIGLKITDPPLSKKIFAVFGAITLSWLSTASSAESEPKAADTPTVSGLAVESEKHKDGPMQNAMFEQKGEVPFATIVCTSGSVQVEGQVPWSEPVVGLYVKKGDAAAFFIDEDRALVEREKLIKGVMTRTPKPAVVLVESPTRYSGNGRRAFELVLREPGSTVEALSLTGPRPAPTSQKRRANLLQKPNQETGLKINLKLRLRHGKFGVLATSGDGLLVQSLPCELQGP